MLVMGVALSTMAGSSKSDRHVVPSFLFLVHSLRACMYALFDYLISKPCAPTRETECHDGLYYDLLARIHDCLLDPQLLLNAGPYCQTKSCWA